ncbi:MAG: SCF ubiquitin ligase complex subunit [Vezdaea aestivalis]|nr:MAG: SCF ubiquitin ligase complex subunit [Vezdaea aestivalis]
MNPSHQHEPPHLPNRTLPLRDASIDPAYIQNNGAIDSNQQPPVYPTHLLRTQNTETSEASSNASTPTRDSEGEFHVVEPNDWRNSQALPSLGGLSMHDKVKKSPPINKLPPELLIAVFTKLSSPADLLSCLQVSRTWAGHSVALLWHRPICNDTSSMCSVAHTLSAEHTYFHYGNLVKRLNLATQPMAKDINDGTLMSMASCKKIERLTLTGCSKLTDTSIMYLLEGNENLLALDVTNVPEITDDSLLKAAEHCKRLQGLNVTGDTNITDVSIQQIAQNCHLLKRLKLNECSKITDVSVMKLAQHCRHILEIDLYKCANIKDVSVSTLLKRGKHLRELRLSFCKLVTDEAFLSLRNDRTFETLRILDLTACENLTDAAVRQITEMAPRLRNLVLAKCARITDAAVTAIARLGKNLHYVHLGHCNQISDQSIKHLIKTCNRIRYIDLACCHKLTDDSIKLLATLPKLRRIGLVKCVQVTDESIFALAKGPPRGGGRYPIGPNSLERVHLSYCERLTVGGIQALLMSCQRLTHLSLTGVNDFLREDFTKFCRQPPQEFTQHQQDMFCVFSGNGVIQLRHHLQTLDHRVLHNFPPAHHPHPHPNPNGVQIFGGNAGNGAAAVPLPPPPPPSLNNPNAFAAAHANITQVDDEDLDEGVGEASDLG